MIFCETLAPGYAMLMSPNKDETAVHGSHCPSDIAVLMRKVLAIPRSCVVLTIAFRWFIFTFYVVTLASLLIQVIHTPYALPRLSCTVAATATTFTLWSWRLKECFYTRLGSKRRGQ